MIPRLKRRHEFVRVSQNKVSVVTSTLIIQALHRESCGLKGETLPKVRIGFTATKRLGNSVKRNRARRRLRSLVEEHIPRFHFEDVDLVLIAKHRCLKKSFLRLGRDLCEGLKNLNFRVLSPDLVLDEDFFTKE